MIGGEAGDGEAPRSDLRDARAGRRLDRRARPGATRTAARRSAATSTAARTAPGHFVKMVHNGIEYGLMAAYAEGLNILRHANVGKAGREVDAETTPLRNPEYYRYDFNLADVTELWRRGSVVVVLAARPDGRGAGRKPGARGVLRPRVGLGRGALDDPRGGRRGRARARPDRVALRAVRLARRGGVPEPRAVRDALRVRRPSREEVGDSLPLGGMLLF